MSNELTAPAPMRGTLTETGMQFANLGELYEFCRVLVKTPFCPAHFKEPATAMIAILYGRDLGLTELQSLQSICVIDNKPAIYGDGFLAVCQGSGSFDFSQFEEHFEGEGEGLTAVSTVARVGGAPMTKSYSIREAKAAGLLGKKNWQGFQRDMLMWRARSRACRALFAVELRGMTSGEEAEDAAEQTITVTAEKPQTLDQLTDQLVNRLPAVDGTPEPVRQRKPRATKPKVEEPVTIDAEVIPEPEPTDAHESRPDGDEIVAMCLEECGTATTIKALDDIYERYMVVPGLTPKQNTAILQAVGEAKKGLRQAPAEHLW